MLLCSRQKSFILLCQIKYKVVELYQELLQTARKQIELADHMLYVTYSMVQETKFLLAIANHVINAARLALQSLLEFEILYKRLEHYNKTFVSEIAIYRNKLSLKYNFDNKYLKLLERLYEIQKYDSQSIMRFKKGDKYILSTGDKISSIDLDSLKRYSNLTKKFIDEIAQAIKKQTSNAKLV
jgi:hypothetical protein